MGLLDQAADVSFKKSADGLALFLPWGKLGAGRVIPRERDAAWIRTYLKVHLISVIVIALPLLVIGKGLRYIVDLTTGAIAFGVFIVLLVVPRIALWLWVRAWPIASEREMTMADALAAGGNEAGPVLLWIGIAGCGLFAAGGLVLLFAGDEIPFALFAVILGGSGLWFLLRVLRARRRT